MEQFSKFMTSLEKKAKIRAKNEKHRDYRQQYYQANKEKLKERYQKNKTQILETRKQYYSSLTPEKKHTKNIQSRKSHYKKTHKTTEGFIPKPYVPSEE